MTALLKNHYQNPTTYTDGNGNRLEVNDVFKTMSNMEDNSVDLIIADPPYFQVYGDFDFGVFKTEKDTDSLIEELENTLENDENLFDIEDFVVIYNGYTRIKPVNTIPFRRDWEDIEN